MCVKYPLTARVVVAKWHGISGCSLGVSYYSLTFAEYRVLVHRALNPKLLTRQRVAEQDSNLTKTDEVVL